MAITIDDFSKIWASTSPLTPYEFSENNYKQGWNFVGGTPPSRQMWDFLQKNNDEKSKFLLDKFGEYLPLSGGTMSGAIIGNPLTLTADDGNGNSADLVLNADGSATLDGNNVITSALTGNVLTANGTSTEENTETTLCSISTHEAGVWLIIGYVELNYSGSALFYGNIITHGASHQNTRTITTGGGGNCNVWIQTLTRNEVVTLSSYQSESGTIRGTLTMVRLA